MNNTDDIILDSSITSKLLEYQIKHTINLIHIITKNRTALDCSDTGSGKTFAAIACCVHLKLSPVIICPKSVISNWVNICKSFGVKPIFIVNYETLKLGKYYDKNSDRVICPYVTIQKKNKTNDWKIIWDIDSLQNVIFIFDEVHKCSNIETENGKMLYYTKKLNKPLLILSATIADMPEKFYLFFYILNFLDPIEVDKKKLTFNDYMRFMIKWVMRDVKPLLKIHAMLFPSRSARMRISAIKDFPETQIVAQPYSMGKTKELEIEKQYVEIEKALKELREKGRKDKGNILVRIMRAHQRIELLKVPTMIELTNDFIENNKSVVIFVNFTKTLELLAESLNTKCIIYGQQTKEQRDKNIELFQSDKSRIIICNIKVSSGISLHDLNGTYPRVSLLSPTWNSIDLVQALGRIHRANAKSVSLQRIIYTSNTIEEKIADKLRTKLKNISEINDGDLDLSIIEYSKDVI